MAKLFNPPDVRHPRRSAAHSDHIVLQNIYKTYKTENQDDIEALSGVSLSVKRNEFLCVVGRSGCGKSTLLNIVAGLGNPSRGTVEVGGRPPHRSNVGMVFQTPILLPWKSVLENVLLPAIIERRDFKKAKTEAERLLAMVGLADFSSRRPSELSGGMQQRAAICRALMCKSDVLLMDEPFGALDALTRDDLAVELKRISEAEDKTVIFVTHSIQEAVFLGSRIVVMTPRPGRIQEIVDGRKDESNDFSVTSSVDFQNIVLHIRNLIKHDCRKGEIYNASSAL